MATPAPERQVRPAFLILAGVAVLAVVGLVLFNLTAAEDPVPVPQVTPVPGAAVPPPAAAPTPVPTPPEIEVFEIFEGRDPFRPLVFEAAGNGGSTPPPGNGGTPPPGDGGGSPPPTDGEPEPTPAPRSGVQVEVLSVADDSKTATVRVGSQVFENAAPGDRLSSGVVIEAIEGQCVRFRRNGSTFTLCEGESVRK